MDVIWFHVGGDAANMFTMAANNFRVIAAKQD